MHKMISPGVRVIRGPDWPYDNQDGGEGCVGTIVSKSNGDSVLVRWDCGTQGQYRTGPSSYELRIFDNAPAGIRHADKFCTFCNADPDLGKEICGVLWACSSCPDVQLCSFHYMNDKHDLNHPFLRLDSSGITDESLAQLVPPRRGSRRITIKGVFAGAKVQRSFDWMWQDQDGGPGKHGKVLEIQDWDKNSVRSVASVAWLNTDIANVYRIGHKGDEFIFEIQGFFSMV